MSEIKFEMTQGESYNELVGGKKRTVKRKVKSTSQKIEKTAIDAIKTMATPGLKKGSKNMKKTMKEAVEVVKKPIITKIINLLKKAIAVKPKPVKKTSTKKTKSTKK